MNHNPYKRIINYDDYVNANNNCRNNDDNNT